MIDVAEILVHWHAGRSLSEMSQSLGVDRKTLRKYVAPAVAAGIVPGGSAKTEEEWHELVRGWFPELADTRLRQVTWPAIAVHHDYIVEQLKARVRMSTIHQRLRDERGLAASVASFRRYVNANLPEEVRRSQVTVWNPRPSEAGEQAQIDYGQLGRWLDPVSGKLRTVQAFVMVLPYSRHMFVRPVLKMDQRTWTECHVAAFEFFVGTPARLVPDNLKTGVDKPDLYDPKLNRSYAEMAAHYGCLIDPARALKPRDKPQVERPMPYVRDCSGGAGSSRRCRRCRPRASGGRWKSRAAGAGRWTAPPRPLCSRPRRKRRCGRCRRAVRAGHVGDGEDRPGHPRPGGPGALFHTVAAHRQDRRRAPDRDDGAVLHRREPGQDPPAQVRGKQTDFGDYPPEKIAFHMRTPAWCRKHAAADRPGLRGGHRRTAGRQRAVPAPVRAGHDRAGRQARPRPGWRPPARKRSPPATRPTAPSRASWPPGPNATCSPPRPGTAARPRSCAVPPPSPTSSPCQAPSLATPCRTPAEATYDRRDAGAADRTRRARRGGLLPHGRWLPRRTRCAPPPR